MIYCQKEEQYNGVSLNQIQEVIRRTLHTLANLMFEGETKAAIRLLTEEAKGGVHHLSDCLDSNKTVRDILIDKHPLGQLAHPDAIIEDYPSEVHSVLLSQLMLL